MYIDLSILNEGITQDKRSLRALKPDFIDIDERDVDELIKFMTEFASQLNYYDLNNNIQGTWEEFLKSDVHIVLIMITRFNMLSYIDQFSAHENELFIAENNAELYPALKRLFSFVMSVLDMLTEFRSRLLAAAAGSKIVEEVGTIVESFDNESYKLMRYNFEASDTLKQDLNIVYPDNVYELDGLIQVKEIFTKGTSHNERVLNALPEIKQLFTDIGTKFNNLFSIATFYHNNSDLLSVKYEPHIALSVAFLHLYTKLQDKLNLTTKNHLDLYYKRILGIQLKAPEADTVHVVFEKDEASADVVLSAGDELLAKVPNQPEPAVYTLDRPIVITDAQIVEFKTLILAGHDQVKNKYGTLTEVEVYNGSYPFVSAGAYLKNKIPATTWPIFGEDQDNLPEANKTMEMSSIGLLLSSPLFYLPEGRRSIKFHIHLDDVSYERLMDYFTVYSRVSKKDLMAVNHNLLTDAFTIDYTDTKGWKTVAMYSAILDIAERKLDIDIQVNNSDEFIDVYNPVIHGDNFDTEWPIFRLLVNNYSVNNPFTFLRTIKMERIGIVVDVKGSKAVKLQNSVGPISTTGTSQLFGPIPSVGAYLDVKSSNIFNKYTKSFCIRLDWIDLPKDPGGWETYYRAYNNKITNNSFQIKLSTLSDGKFIPKLTDQQQMALFEINEDASLKSATQLQNIDNKRLFFNKRPLLDKQDTLADKNFTEGALRLELVTPKDAFGHRLFTQIFPEVVLYNAKHSKKLELPNQPYIPSIRSLSIDYTLEHSEALASKGKTNEETDLKVFHIYPFGYDGVYPATAKAPYNLIPDFDQNNNLFIGLSGIKPGQALSLLFQIDEDNFSSMSESKTLWSYLDNNQWINFNDENVMFDATNNFINSGIISICMPESFKTGNTILSPKYYWIRASSKNNIKSKIKGIYTQAVSATRVVSASLEVLNLQPGAIKTFKRKVFGIQSITQPFASFGGKAAETDAQYYVRISERLRHGQRLLSSRDIELAILEQFPEIYMAKCIAPTAYSPAYIEKHRPGLRVILVPMDKVNGVFLSERPSVNLATRYQVNRFLQNTTPSFLNVEVRGPVYESIKVICSVKFTNDSSMGDTGLNIGRLNDDIKRYLCPWLFDKGADFKIGTGIYMVELLNFIKNLPYVKDIGNFSLAHFYFEEAIDDDGLKARVNYSYSDEVYIKGSLPQSVLVPNKQHLITVIGANDDVDDRRIGISEFTVMDELLVDADDSVDIIKEPEPDLGNKADENKGFFDLVISHNLD